MRAIWKGSVSFGLVSVPVRLYSATESHDVRFHQVRASDGSRIKYKRVAEVDGEEVAYADIAKGYQTEDGRTVVLDDDDLASLPMRSSKEIAVEKFVPADQIDPLLLDKPYYLEPDKAAIKPYALLREALRDADRMALVTISLRTREALAVLRVKGDVIVLQTMLWPDEIRAADFDVLDDVPEPKDSERAMAAMLIESMAGDFDEAEHADDYREAVEALVQAKLGGGDVIEAPAPEDDGGEVVDLLAALQKSVDRAKAARGESTGTSDSAASGAADAEEEDAAEESDQDEAKPAAKKTAKKAASKSASKTAAKKSAARKAG